jgi:hypothetical protein
MQTSETIRIPILARPFLAVGMLVFFSFMLLISLIGGLFAIVLGSLAFIFTGKVTMTYKVPLLKSKPSV